MLWLAALLACPLETSAESQLDQSLDRLISALPGGWDGAALTTPIGQVNYDLAFYRCSESLIAGTAATGASLHFWQFHRQLEGYRIRFMSTFAGNRDPVWLEPTAFKQGTLFFHAPKLELLSLSIAHTTPDQLDINVFHWGKHHVHIRLQRTPLADLSLPPAQGEQSSCRGSPE